MEIKNNEIYTLSELEKLSGIPVTTWRFYIKKKRLKAKCLGRHYVIEGSEILRFINAHKRYKHRINYIGDN